MYTVHGNGVIWDKERNKPLVHFDKGVFVTDSEDIAAKLHGLGFRVEGYEPKAEGGESDGTDGDDGTDGTDGDDGTDGSNPTGKPKGKNA